MGAGARHTHQFGDDVPDPASGGLAPKKKSLIAREQDAGERSAWRAEAMRLDPAQVIVLDETSTSTRLTPLRARAPRGQRAVGIISRGRWESITLLATMSLDETDLRKRIEDHASTDRLNDLHFTNDEKRRARELVASTGENSPQ